MTPWDRWVERWESGDIPGWIMGVAGAVYAFWLARQGDGDGVSVMGLALLALSWMIQTWAKRGHTLEAAAREIVDLGVRVGYGAGGGVTVGAGLEPLASAPEGYLIATALSIFIMLMVTGSLALALVRFASSNAVGCGWLFGSVAVAWALLQVAWAFSDAEYLVSLRRLWVGGPPPLPTSLLVVLCIAWTLGSRGPVRFRRDR